jgi:hypothetical protein
LLNVSPNTLRAWERRFRLPNPQRSRGRHRLYTQGEVAALRDSLQEGLSSSSAVSRAREGLAADTNSLVGALVSYEMRPLAPTQRLRRSWRYGLSSARSRRSWFLAWTRSFIRRGPSPQLGHSASGGPQIGCAEPRDWRPPPVRPLSVLLGDASRDELDPDAPHIRALELFCVRAGVKVLSRSPRGISGIGDAVSMHRPDLVVVAGATSWTTPWRGGHTRSGSRSDRFRLLSTVGGGSGIGVPNCRRRRERPSGGC